MMQGQGIDSIISGLRTAGQAIAKAPLLRQKAELESALNNARIYQNTMSGDKTAAEADGLRMTNDNRRNVDDFLAKNPSFSQGLQTAIKIGAFGGDLKANNLAQASGELQTQDFQNRAAANIDNPDMANRWNVLAKPGQAYLPHENVGTTGYSMNKATGALNDNGALGVLFAGKTNSEIGENRAQAANANASAAQHRAMADKTLNDMRTKSGAPVQIGTDASGEPVYGNAPTGKVMPPTALKLQQEELDAIATASATQADLAAIENQVKAGKLDFGLTSNLVNRGKNMLGMSDEKSQNFASFRASMEKLRNDSLRLNKGVQTEGDSQRAWNELFENINDRNVVMQRLNEIRRINARAAKFRKMNIDVLRSNYGNPPLDVSGYTQAPPALNGGQSSVPQTTAPAAGGVKFLGFE